MDCEAVVRYSTEKKSWLMIHLSRPFRRSLSKIRCVTIIRGELVPTGAELARQEGRDYKPASVLLEHIRAARANE
jgi:hypothetical protein